MTRTQIKGTLALLAALVLSACAGNNEGLTNAPDTVPDKPVIGNPNAKGTAGIRNHTQLRGAIYATLGFPAPVATVDTFITTNRQTFNGQGFATSVTTEEIQKRMELAFLACTQAIAAQATNNLGPLVGSWINSNPSVVTDAQISGYAASLWTMATGEASMPSDVAAGMVQFKADFINGAANNNTTTKALASSVCGAVLASPKAMSIL